MSADNYIIIRTDGDKFVATMGFASDLNVPAIHEGDSRFDTLGEAMRYADEVYTEYGVTLSPEVKSLLDGVRAK